MSAAIIPIGAIAPRAALQPLPLRQLPTSLLYYPGVRCPGCHGTHFEVRRLTAECPSCHSAMIIPHTREKD